MSQFDFGNLESPLPGSVFINDNLEPWRDALYSMHSGTSRPPYAVDGLVWRDITTNPWNIYLFDGADDVLIGTVDTTTHVFTPVIPSTVPLLSSNNTFTGDNTFTGSAIFRDNNFTIQDNSDNTKQLQLQLSGLTAATTRTLTPPDANATIAGINIAQTFSALQTFSSGISLGNETLSVYDEGTFTPTIIGQSTAGSGTYTLQTGVYTRVGRLVFFAIALGWSAHTGTGNMRVAGLPVAADSLPVSVPVAVYQSGLSVGSGLQFAAQVINSTTEIALYSNNPAGNATQLSIDTSVAELRLQGCYFV